MSLFGTDGIRGEAGVPPLDPESIRRVGQALATSLAVAEAHPRVLIGRDTRLSGARIESWLASGIAAGGGEAVSAGILPTPAIAYLTRRFEFSAGVVISASHNPYPDNGVKIFSSRGGKCDEALEQAIEEAVARPDRSGAQEIAGELRALTTEAELEKEYVQFLLGTLPPCPKLPPIKVALDCAHGAAYQVGPELLAQLGLETVPMSATPDGMNINQNCGSTHPEALIQKVMTGGCQLGAALDGDGDRLLLVDGRGRLVDGDAILLLCARRLRAEGRLRGAGVAATVMSNLALENALARERIAFYRTPVGDKYVAEEMARRGLSLGGEQSGHVIFSELASTGDGLLTLLQVLRAVAIEGRPLEELVDLQPYPQILVNVRVKEKREIGEVPEIRRAMEEAEERMAGRGRVLVRYSGTEPVLRIMVEGPEEAEIRALSASIAEAARRALAAP